MNSKKRSRTLVLLAFLGAVIAALLYLSLGREPAPATPQAGFQRLLKKNGIRQPNIVVHHPGHHPGRPPAHVRLQRGDARRNWIAWRAAAWFSSNA